MKRIYTTPAGERSQLYADMLSQPHVLIAGATGSGKSVVINGIIHAGLFNSPARFQLILIDLKMVELADYRQLPHCIEYADSKETALNALENALAIIEQRFKEMQRRRERLFNGSDVYVIIDEMADLLTTCKRESIPLIQRICQIGRAARVHVIAGTQHIPIVPTSIRVNFDSRVGLRTGTAQDSRNIIGVNGCEQLPRYGNGFYKTPAQFNLYNIPMVQDNERYAMIDYWKRNARPRLQLFAH